MKTIEFTAKINQGMIAIPKEYDQELQEELEVEVTVKPKRKKRLMDRLAENPVSVEGWRNLTRDEINLNINRHLK
ncbi:MULTISPECIES: hypothetical protein [unclassified Synechocystis]|uniref:hypothetical protein n=1 Tax=unclassified Synechocystis TaxID=2640012 RepID=UPI0004094F20|nr:MULTISPECIES: hypothetical protein [unclassified Synechocystis]AIE73890.1 Programmed cell death antitoxin MazE like A [Synechocystis sp. PCC 6714]